jgi:hypothetical protein
VTTSDLPARLGLLCLGLAAALATTGDEQVFTLT